MNEIDPLTTELHQFQEQFIYRDMDFFISHMKPSTENKNNHNPEDLQNTLNDIQDEGINQYPFTLQTVGDICYLCAKGKTSGMRIAAGVIFERLRQKIILNEDSNA